MKLAALVQVVLNKSAALYASLQTDSHFDETLFNQITWRVIHYLNFAFQFEGCMIGCYILYRFAAGEVCWCFYKYGNGMKSGSSQHQSRRCPNHWDQISSQRLFSQTDKISLDIGGLKVTQRWYYVNIWHSFEIEMSRGKIWARNYDGEMRRLTARERMRMHALLLRSFFRL